MYQPTISRSTQTIKRYKSVLERTKIDVQAILEVEFERFVVFVFPGMLSDFDILIKYKEEGKNKIRTPKHIHWAVDFLLKKQGSKELTTLFLVRARHYWDLCSGLNERSFDEISNRLIEGFNYYQTDEFLPLNSFGEYEIDFLACLMILLPIQEKTNNPNAFMFKQVLDNLLVDDLDIFRVVSVSSFGGR